MSDVASYPLRFEPLWKRYVWGGRRLASLLRKPIGEESCAESWEICDRGHEQSVVTNGPWAGKTLHQLVVEQGPALLGRHHPQTSFPLLFKFLDAQQILSVQVHPNDRQAALLVPPDRGKSEAWYVLATEPGSRIYAGLKRGFDRAAVQRELSRGTLELCLHSFEPRVGDCVYVPAGLIHALGAGVLVAELQQSSDTTYRLFDWNRVGSDGQARPLHMSNALRVADFSLGPVDPRSPEPIGPPDSLVERLVSCEHFVWDRWTLARSTEFESHDRCHLLAVVEGRLKLEAEGSPTLTIDKGDTVLLPAATRSVCLLPDGQATLLDAYLP